MARHEAPSPALPALGSAGAALSVLSARPAQIDGGLEAVEIEMLLEAIFRHYGYDFREYALSSLRRRLWRRARDEGVSTISGLQERVLHDPACMERLLVDLSINVTSLFRDPTFYQALRGRVVPLLRTYPFVRVWNAGCSSGEEALSVAILLHEAGLLDRVRIYATDVNEAVLRRAKAGCFPADKIAEYGQNYLRAGGSASFEEYFELSGDVATFAPWLSQNIVFAQHNLASDRSFNEFHLILCRNVMIYFARSLQDEVHQLLYESLASFGVLALGRKESIRFTRYEERYDELDGREKLYRKVR
jgi:chemotaxis protein methyltransferase CheR